MIFEVQQEYTRWTKQLMSKYANCGDNLFTKSYQIQIKI